MRPARGTRRVDGGRADAPTEVIEERRPRAVTREYEWTKGPPVPPPAEPPPRAWLDELGWALVALVIVLAIGFGLWWYFAHRGAEKRTVPTVTGMPVVRAV